MKSYLGFKEVGTSESGKTKRVEVYSTAGGGVLGWIYWLASWRKYIFHPNPGAVFDPGCMREIADHTEVMTKEHKA